MITGITESNIFGEYTSHWRCYGAMTDRCRQVLESCFALSPYEAEKALRLEPRYLIEEAKGYLQVKDIPTIVNLLRNDKQEAIKRINRKF